MGELWSRLSEKQKRVVSWLLVGTTVGIGLLILQPTKPNTSSQGTLGANQGQQSFQAPAVVENSWEKELTRILDQMLGAKDTQVFLTLEGGRKLEIAYATTEEARSSADGGSERRFTSTPVTLRDDGARKEVPLILEQLEPKVRGVLVVVNRTFDSSLRFQLAQAVATVLQVPMYRIEVLFKQ